MQFVLLESFIDAERELIDYPTIVCLNVRGILHSSLKINVFMQLESFIDSRDKFETKMNIVSK